MVNLEHGTTSGLYNEVVVAGAGTGKTHALVNDYLFTLLGLDAGGVPRSPHRILAITFTEKAAAEMRSRVHRRLALLAHDPTSDLEVNARAAKWGLELPSGELIDRILRRLSGALICTFHALAATLLRDLALRAQIDPGFRILDDTEEPALLAEAAEAVVIDALAQGDLQTAELVARFQLRKMGYQKGLVDLLGSVHNTLAERGLHTQNIQAVVTPQEADASVATTLEALHEALRRLLSLTKGNEAMVGDRLSLEHKLQTLTTAIDDTSEDRPMRISAALDDLWQQLQGRFVGKGAGEARDVTRGLLGELAVALSDRSTASSAQAVLRLLGQLTTRVRAEKDARGVLGFGDLLLRLRDLLKNDLEVRQRVKSRFDRILVDEYQDTSPVQEDIVALLAEDIGGAASVGPGVPCMGRVPLGAGRLFIVGDPKQSIYGFRGADASLFRHVLDVVCNGTELCPKSGIRSSLSVSRRSRRPVVEAVNLVAAASMGEAFSPDEALDAMRGGGGPAGAVWRAGKNDALTGEVADAFAIARQVRSMLHGDDAPDALDDEPLWVGPLEEPRACQARDVAVLVRRIKTAGPIAAALAHQGIPARITGGVGFFSRPEVTDLIAALRLVVEPTCELASLTVLRSPLVALSDDEIVQLIDATPDWSRGMSWEMAVVAAQHEALPALAADRVLAFERLLTSLRQRLHEQSVSKLLDVLVDQGNYVLGIGVEVDAADRLANLDKLRTLVENTQGDAIATIDRLWGYLDAPPREGTASAVGPEVDAVKIMTIHQSKGLEFPVVILADLGATPPYQSDDIAFDPQVGLAVGHRGRPIGRSVRKCRPRSARCAIDRVRDVLEKRNTEEMARVLYVAMTRARDFLYCIGEAYSTSRPSLRRFLTRSRTQQRAQFDRLLCAEKLDGELPSRRALDATELALPQEPPPRVVPLRRRLSPSALGGHAAVPTATIRQELGELAHQMVARLGEQHDLALLDNDTALKQALKQQLRAKGNAPSEDQMQRLMARCQQTLRGPVRDLIAQEWELSFEEALTVEVGQTSLVGVADLIARQSGRTLVVELKSSAKAAMKEGTQAQLAAYAHALAKRDNGPVWMCAWVLGEGGGLSRLYDGNAYQVLLEAVERANAALDEGALLRDQPAIAGP